MTKSKSTKRALFASLMSLVICCAMLIGSTFAWFTDSVTTGKNKIVAGNLDVELYTKDAKSGEYVPVSADNSLFNENALWEPGYTEVVYLKVANLGTLALKYKLAVTVDSETPGTNVNGETFKLSDYLVFGQATGTTETVYDSREAAQQAAGSTMGLNDYTNENVLYPAASDNTSEEYVALVVYMPTTVGNEANYKTGTEAPTIDLGVTLVATQTPYESDSFDEKYDENAWIAAAATDNNNGTYTYEDQLYVLDENAYVAVTADANTDGLYTDAEGNQYVATAAALTAAAAVASDNGVSIDVIQDITETFTSTATTGAEKALSLATDGTVIDLNGNTLSIESASGANGIVGASGVSATISNGTITMNESYGSSYPVIHANGGTITLDNMTVNLTGSGYGVSAGSDGGKLIIKNSTVTSTGTSKNNPAVYSGSKATVEIENSTIVGYINMSGNNTLTIYSGDFTQASFYFGGSVTKSYIYAGTFAASTDQSTLKSKGLKVGDGCTVTTNSDGTWTVTAG